MNTSDSSGYLIDVKCFDTEQILTCGQCFRFSKENDDEYSIIAHSKRLHIKQQQNGIFLYPSDEAEYESIWKNYFDIHTDYEAIKKILSANDSVMHDAIEFAPGIRILNQDPWECLISFIISQNNNIPRIKRIIDSISRRFGTSINNGEVFAFPSPEQLEGATIQDYMECGTGFRAKYIADAAKRVVSGELVLNDLAEMSTDILRESLMNIYGVGQKVSDCVMLFSFGRKELFPVDVWVKRIMEHFYFNSQDTSVNEIHKLAEMKFGEYGGYAQQYLFHYARQYKGFDNKGKDKGRDRDRDRDRG